MEKVVAGIVIAKLLSEYNSRIESRADGADGSSTRYEYQPESRTVVHRGFVNEKRRHGHHEAHAPEGDHEDHSNENLLICTDVRSPKIDQLLASTRAPATRSPDAVPPTQSGPLASICWCIESKLEPYVVSAQSGGERVAGLTAEQADRLKPRREIDFGWEAERIRVYEKLSWELKASFVGRSAPGSKLIEGDGSEKPTDPEKRLESGDHELRETALEELRLDRLGARLSRPASNAEINGLIADCPFKTLLLVFLTRSSKTKPTGLVVVQHLELGRFGKNIQGIGWVTQWDDNEEDDGGPEGSSPSLATTGLLKFTLAWGFSLITGKG
ncbi:hypothetical protein H4Q26_014075 [Puccinia striiformis f. sp. tritici PST-130]|nr:hypothetical protein H4Q26_014075 [Puccinia striiformis f. sp. tritici PST-130]